MIDADLMKSSTALRIVNGRLSEPISYNAFWMNIAAGLVPAERFRKQWYIREGHIDVIVERLAHAKKTEQDRPRTRLRDGDEQRCT
jgi:hypothetical protein